MHHKTADDGLSEQEDAADAEQSSSLMVVLKEPLECPMPPDEQHRWDRLVEYDILDTVRWHLQRFSGHQLSSPAPSMCTVHALHLCRGSCCASRCGHSLQHYSGLEGRACITVHLCANTCALQHCMASHLTANGVLQSQLKQSPPYCCSCRNQKKLMIASLNSARTCSRQACLWQNLL